MNYLLNRVSNRAIEVVCWGIIGILSTIMVVVYAAIVAAG